MASAAASNPQKRPEVESEIEIEIETSPPRPRPALAAIDASSNTADASSSSVANAASSSTAANPNSNKCFSYTIFINHRGKDVKKTFASHLYRGLTSQGFEVFLDQWELQKGEEFPAQIEVAIKTASVHVAIFSPLYTESEWCLNELVEMLKTGVSIIPVFHNVKPNQLRRTRDKDGQYAKGLQKLEKETTQDSKQRYDSTTIENWNDALDKVANISGFDLEEYDSEAALVEKIVAAVSSTIKQRGLYVAKYPTGLDGKVKDFEDTILSQQQYSKKPQIVGIVGSGGVGKTALAIELFNRRRSHYGISYFLSDVRENASKSSLHSLQSKLLKGLIKRDVLIDSVGQGIEILNRHLSSSRALIVLDDVDDAIQLHAFSPVQNVLTSDSLILITSRDRNVLTRSGVQNTSIYKLTGLDTNHSRELFCYHAFNRPDPVPGFEPKVDDFLKACDGLPLSLKVLGELVYGINKPSEWEDQLDRLQQILPHDIQDRLRISYDALHRDEQEIFLDIACFFIGEKRDTAIRIWDGTGWKGSVVFQNLENKSLVEVDSECKIKMHHHLRDMGREIVESSGGLQRRIWRHTEIIDDLLQQSYVITGVRGIRMLDADDSSEIKFYKRWSHELFWNRMMKSGNDIGTRKVQLLDTEGGMLGRILRRVHSPKLIWLRWSKCPYYSLPSWVPMENLRVLRLSGSLKTLWRGKSQAPLQLRELVIDSPLLKLPKSIGKLKDLELIVLNENILKALPDEFCDLLSLKHLTLSHYSKLKSLPDLFRKLKKLEHLNLSHSYYLQKLPGSFGELTNLQHLDLSNSKSLQELPESFGDLNNLKHLYLSHSSLQELPDSFSRLINLQHLDLSCSQSLQELPNTFGDLTQLKHVDLSKCSLLENLPDSFANLSQLEYLNLSDCRSTSETLINQLWKRTIPKCKPKRYHILLSLTNSISDIL